MHALTETLRTVGLVLLLVLSRIGLLVAALALLLGLAATTVGGALGLGRLFHLFGRPSAAGHGTRRHWFSFHR